MAIEGNNNTEKDGSLLKKSEEFCNDKNKDDNFIEKLYDKHISKSTKKCIKIEKTKLEIEELKNARLAKEKFDSNLNIYLQEAVGSFEQLDSLVLDENIDIYLLIDSINNLSDLDDYIKDNSNFTLDENQNLLLDSINRSKLDKAIKFVINSDPFIFLGPDTQAYLNKNYDLIDIPEYEGFKLDYDYYGKYAPMQNNIDGLPINGFNAIKHNNIYNFSNILLEKFEDLPVSIESVNKFDSLINNYELSENDEDDLQNIVENKYFEKYKKNILKDFEYMISKMIIIHSAGFPGDDDFPNLEYLGKADKYYYEKVWKSVSDYLEFFSNSEEYENRSLLFRNSFKKVFDKKMTLLADGFVENIKKGEDIYIQDDKDIEGTISINMDIEDVGNLDFNLFDYETKEFRKEIKIINKYSKVDLEQTIMDYIIDYKNNKIKDLIKNISGIKDKIDNRSYTKGNTGESITTIQNGLQKLGYYGLNIDNIFGNGTKKSVENFQKDNNLEVNGKVGSKELDIIITKLGDRINE